MLGVVVQRQQASAKYPDGGAPGCFEEGAAGSGCIVKEEPRWKGRGCDCFWRSSVSLGKREAIDSSSKNELPLWQNLLRYVRPPASQVDDDTAGDSLSETLTTQSPWS